MTKQELDTKLRSIEKDIADIRQSFGLVPPSRAIRVPTYDLLKQPDEIERRLKEQDILIEVLRETVEGFGLKFDKLCKDRDMQNLNPSVPDVEGMVWGKQEGED